MDPSLVIFGIRALVRLGRAGADSYSQYARDKAILIPALKFPSFDKDDFIVDVLLESDQVWRLREGGPLAQYWTGSEPDPNVPGAREALYMAAVQAFAERQAKNNNLLPERGVEVAGELLITQWAKGEGPVGPIGRFVLTLADVALEFVGANPGMLGLGGSGEKLIGALAANLAQMIPDDAADFGPKSQFTQRLLGIVLRAGLDALSQHPDAIVKGDHMEQLVRNVVLPVVQSLPADLSEQARWRDVVEVLMGPAARAAVDTVAGNPRAFLGSEFDPKNALGALTQALFHETQGMGLREVFSEAGWLAIYKAALGVAADRPELFVADASGERDAVARDLIAGIAGKLRDSPPPFGGDLGAELIGAVLEVVRVDGPRFAKGPWQQDAVTLVGQVVDGLESVLAGDGGADLRTVLSQPQMLELARTVIRRAAQTPGIVDGDRGDAGALAVALARVIAKDKAGAMAPTDWLAIADVVANDVFANPGRLFATTNGKASPALGIVEDILAAAAVDRGKGGVLFGATLRDALVIAVHAATGNADGAGTNRAAVVQLVERLSDRVQTQNGRLGSKEWLWLFRTLVGGVLETGTVGELGEQQLAQLLAGGGTT
jgi:hypothetical protein